MTLVRTCLAALLGLMLGANVLAQNGGSSTMLDTLFSKLQTATDPMAIQSLEAAIWEQWIVVPDGPQRELMMRGIAEMQQRQLKQSVETFSKLIEIAPDLSEAWNKRATAHWLLGDFPASLNDICETVKRGRDIMTSHYLIYHSGCAESLHTVSPDELIIRLQKCSLIS